MRSIFIYEFLTAGGCWSLGNEPPAGSLLAEGRAMRDALAIDAAAISADVEVHLFHDARLPDPELPQQRLHRIEDHIDLGFRFGEMLESIDAAILIAPEFSRQMLSLIETWEIFSAKTLFSPGSATIQLCGDKQQTCDHLKSYGIHTPRGRSFQQLPAQVDPDLFPAVLKPRDGCGSQSVQRLDSPAELARVDLSVASNWRLEKFHPGTPVSVSLLTGPAGLIPLQPCTQNLSDDGCFTYHGGSTPLPPLLAERATRIALAAAQTLPSPRGYLGIDIVLGSAENGRDDVVIEINPRLTTSYLGLRQACEQNLAAAMLQWAMGEPVLLTFSDRHIEFSAASDLQPP